MKKNKRCLLLLILILGLGIRLVFFFSIKPWDPNVVEEEILIFDSYGYNQLAVYLHEFTFNNWNAARTPGYPVFLALIYSFFGVNPYLAILAQIILSTLNIFLVYKIANAIFKNKSIAIFAALLIAIDPHQALYSNYLLTETLFVTFYLLSTFLLIISIEKHSLKHIIYSGIMLGLSVLVRPAGQYLILIYSLYILFFFKHKWKVGSFIIMLIYCIVFLTILFPWQLHNYLSYDRYAISTLNGRVLIDGIVSTEAMRSGESVDEVRSEFVSRTIELGYDTINNPFDKNDILMPVVIDYIKKNKISYLKNHLKGSTNVFIGLATKHIYESLRLGKGTSMKIKMFASKSIFDEIKSFFKSKTMGELIIGLSIIIYLALVYLSFFYTIITLVYTRRHQQLFLIISIILYFALITGVIGLARYRVPIMPIMVIGSAFGIVRLFNRYIITDTFSD